MVGLIAVRKGHLYEGIELMQKGLEQCPWNKNWRADLIQACQLAGEDERAAALQQGSAAAALPQDEESIAFEQLTLSAI